MDSGVMMNGDTSMATAIGASKDSKEAKILLTAGKVRLWRTMMADTHSFRNLTYL